METSFIIYAVILLLMLFPTWKIYAKAGLNTWLSLTLLIPVIGLVLCPLILGGSNWKLSNDQVGHDG